MSRRNEVFPNNTFFVGDIQMLLQFLQRVIKANVKHGLKLSGLNTLSVKRYRVGLTQRKGYEWKPGYDKVHQFQYLL